jgi:hypothetical protein
MMPSTPAMIFREYVVLPALDTQENPTKQRQVVSVFSQDGDLGGRP